MNEINRVLEGNYDVKVTDEREKEKIPHWDVFRLFWSPQGSVCGGYGLRLYHFRH